MQVIAVALCLGSFALLCMAKSASSATIHTDCGGVVEVGVASPATINYKLNEEYDNDEQCVWTVRLRDARSAAFTKIESGFELRYDFVQLSSFQYGNVLLPYETRTLGNQNDEETVNMEAPIIFVIFSSDGSNSGTGFSLEIEAFDERPYDYVATDFFSDERIGNVTQRPYSHGMMSTWVFTANEADSLDLGVNFNTEYLYDFISVFHVERNGGRILFFPYGLLSGESTRFYTLTFYTTFVVLFKSDSSNIPSSNPGFDMDWRAYGDGSGTEKP